MQPSDFVAALRSITMEAVFNPYKERCPVFDRAHAAEVRRANLLAVIEQAIQFKVKTVWIARDLGYRGGRRTGLPLTDEVHLPAMSRVFGGISLMRATKGELVSERTAKIIWQYLLRLGQPVFLWNIFPLHPFEPGDPFSNRSHTRVERRACESLLHALLEMLSPQQIIAIGRDAEMALTQLGLPCRAVRHPSYGGESDFIKGMVEIYGIRECSD